VVGDAVNLAARLELKAPIGEVLLGDTTVRELAGIGADASPEQVSEAVAALVPQDEETAARRVPAAIGVNDAHSSVPEETFAAVRVLLERDPSGRARCFDLGPP
jgi:hypothetical protein